MKILSVEEMRRIEQAADAGGWSYATMMEHAGSAVASTLLQRVGDLSNRLTLILVGPGNNGGDGLVIARLLHEEACPVAVYCWKSPTPDQSSSEATENLRLVQQRKLPLVVAEDDPEYAELARLLREADVVVDALLGTGVTRPITGQLAAILSVVQDAMKERRSTQVAGPGAVLSPVADAVHDADRPRYPYVVAVDCPSGLNCDTGALDAAALTADLTVTFAHPKRGHFLFPGAAACGEVLVADIGTDPELAEDVHLELATPRLIADMLPARRVDAHKGTFGRALLVVGSANYTGAAYLAGAAATRIGTGLVTLAVAESLHPTLAATLHEPTWVLLPEETGVIAPDAVKLVRTKASTYQALLVGCGLTHEKPAAEFVNRLLLADQPVRSRIGFVAAQPPETTSQTLPPTVVDADGLNILAQTDGWWRDLATNCVLTPHPGEMARLSSRDVSQVTEQRWSIASEAASEWQQVVLLKGAYTVIAAPDGRLMVLPFANPGLATAGTGDVLAGTIVGLLAQGLPPFEATVAGGYLHALAGELARQDIGATGMVAGDLLTRLPAAIRAIGKEF